MIGKTVAQKGKFFGWLRPFTAVFVVLFLLGYNLTLAGIQQSAAIPSGTNPPPQQNPMQPSTAVVAPTTCPPMIATPCEAAGTALRTTQGLANEFLADLVAQTVNLEDWLDSGVVYTLYSEYDQLDWLERNMIDWWKTMWYYNLLPSYQQMSNQIPVELAIQSLQLHQFADATAATETRRDLDMHAIDDRAKVNPEEQVCVAATAGGGFTRSMAFSRAMLQAWEMKSLAAGLNEKTDPDGNTYPGATSAAGADLQRYQDWQNIFCDAQGNSVSDVPCGPNPDLNVTNADVLPVKYLFNNLTINVNDTTSASNGGTEGKNLELGLEYLITNLIGQPTMNAVTPVAIAAPEFPGGYLGRRSYLARYAAIRSVPDIVAGWRMPGSQMGKWIADLRERGGVSSNLVQDTNNGSKVLVDGISKNPSYKEIMHALSIDRFNSREYATEMITDPAKVDLEKLDVSVFYLMQLRDYYELLERTALTLAVQVSIMADQQAGSNINSVAPTSRAASPGPGGG